MTNQGSDNSTATARSQARILARERANADRRAATPQADLWRTVAPYKPQTAQMVAWFNEYLLAGAEGPLAGMEPAVRAPLTLAERLVAA